jgi:hypothetical protein
MTSFYNFPGMRLNLKPNGEVSARSRQNRTFSQDAIGILA